MEALNLKDHPPQTVSEGFLGTNYSSACAWWTEPDTIETYVSEEGKTVTSNFTGREEPGRLYVPEQLEVKTNTPIFSAETSPCV